MMQRGLADDRRSLLLDVHRLTLHGLWNTHYRLLLWKARHRRLPDRRAHDGLLHHRLTLHRVKRQMQPRGGSR